VNQLREGVTKPLAARLRVLAACKRIFVRGNLRRVGNAHLELHGGRGAQRHRRKNPPVDNSLSPPLVMRREEMAQTGYAALHWRGWNAQRLDAAAKQRGISSQQMLVRLCHEVIRDYSQSLAKTVFEAGVPRRKISMHIVALDSVRPSDTTDHPPIWTAINPYSVPGFTLSNFSGALYDMKKLKAKTAAADPGQTRFVCAEGYARDAKRRRSVSQLFERDVRQRLDAGAAKMATKRIVK
jgi:hypothetical protein